MHIEYLLFGILIGIGLLLIYTLFFAYIVFYEPENINNKYKNIIQEYTSESTNYILVR